MLKSKSNVLIKFSVTIFCFFSVLGQTYASESKVKTALFVVNGLKMSANIKNLELEEVFKDFSKVTGIKITISEARKKETVTIAFKDLPFGAGVQAIIGKNFSLIYGSATAKDVFKKSAQYSLLNEVEIYNSLKSRLLKRKIKQEVFAYNPEILAQRVLKYGDPQGRIEMMQRIQREGIELDLDVLKKTLKDDNNLRVKQLALEEIVDKFKPEEAENFLLKIIEKDAEPELKEFAESLLITLREENAWMYKK